MRLRMSRAFEAVRAEVDAQATDLPPFAVELSERPVDPRELGGTGCVFVGAGDSLAAALAAERLSDFRARAFDPRELLGALELVAGRHLYVISVSGRTRSNIALAAAAEQAAKVTAITARSDSPLAQTADEVLELSFHKEEGLTPGTVAFTASLLAACSRVAPLPPLGGIERAITSAEKDFEGLRVRRGATHFFLGSGLGYPLALYGAAKIHEIAGEPAQYQWTEQFGHMELFSARPGDPVVLLALQDEREEAEMIVEELHNRHLFPIPLISETVDPIPAMLTIAVTLQIYALSVAQQLGLRAPAFLLDPDRLKTSDALIY